MKPQHTWTIDETHAEWRLDLFLNESLPELTRSGIQKHIRNKNVTVNGKTVTVHHFLKTEDRVEWIKNDETHVKPRRGATRPNADVLHLAAADRGEAAPIAEPTIVAETKDWLVINKPIGLLVHPSSGRENEPSLIDWLMAHDKKIDRVGEDPLRPGIVHRLDREVSGLMVIAKTQAAYDSLHDQFAKRKTIKHYLALVHGEIAKDEGDIKFRIARSSTKARMAARPAGAEGGRAAWTHFDVKKRFRGATLLELQILSGRTHQIRAHLHGIGHPVIGDDLYQRTQTDRNITPPRLMLQSILLSFTDPTTGKEQTFTLEPDKAFAEVEKELT